jgi:hypothetical protein
VVWIIQYFYPLPEGTLARQFQRGDGKANGQTLLAKFLLHQSEGHPINETMDMPIDIHLSRASFCVEQLISIIGFYNPNTFPLMAPAMVRGIAAQHYYYS